jgi:hypothetical protein
MIAVRRSGCRTATREADGCSIVEDVHREPLEADHVGEPIDDGRDTFERVGKGASSWHVRLPKPRQVGSDEPKPVRELRDGASGDAKPLNDQLNYN